MAGWFPKRGARLLSFNLRVLHVPLWAGFTYAVVLFFGHQFAEGHDPDEGNDPPLVQADILVPQGFSVTTFASGLNRPTSIAYGPDGALYIAQQDGLILRAADINDDGVAEGVTRFAQGFDQPLGIAFRGSALYVSSRTIISVVEDQNRDGVADTRSDIITGLPALGNHQNNGVAFSPDDRLYIGHGSTTNLGPEPSPMNAAILRANPDGSELTVFASGLRNPYDLAFNSAGDLFATDNGADDPLASPPDELNHVIEGGHYGFPKYHGDAPETSGTISPLVKLPPHSAATGIAEWLDGDLFIALWNNTPGSQNVVRVRLFRQGNRYEAQSEEFATGFEHPIDVTVSPDNHLTVADYNGTIYQITVEDARLNVVAQQRSVQPQGKLAVAWGQVKQNTARGVQR